MECLRLRVKDLEFERRAIIVRDGKGAQDRVTVLPDSLVPLLKEHLQRVKALHEQDLGQGYGAVFLPDALARRYPNADREWGWQYVFPASHLSQDPRSSVTCLRRLLCAWHKQDWSLRPVGRRSYFCVHRQNAKEAPSRAPLR